MRFLISGHPRTRTAWLCALINAHGVRCYHDAITNNIPLDTDAGIADPTIACYQPAEGVMACTGPRICLLRRDWQHAFEKWSGCEVLPSGADRIETNVQSFQRGAKVTLSYELLDDRHVVGDVLKLCGVEPDPELLRVFDQLKIEQHQAKAQRAFAEAGPASIIHRSPTGGI